MSARRHSGEAIELASLPDCAASLRRQSERPVKRLSLYAPAWMGRPPRDGHCPDLDEWAVVLHPKLSIATGLPVSHSADVARPSEKSTN